MFGESEFALRLLSVLFGSFTILGVYLIDVDALGRDLWTAAGIGDLYARCRGLSLLAVALVALSALQIRYS